MTEELVLEVSPTVADVEATVLIIDDSPENRYVVRRALTRAGMAVIEADTGAEGARLAGVGPDLIVLDVNLPDISGFALCRRLKTDPVTAHVPVIHLSQSAVDDTSRVRGLEGGADAYLTDATNGSVLVATVRALLRMRRAEDELRREADDSERLAELNSHYANARTGEEVIRALLEMHARRIPMHRAVFYAPRPWSSGPSVIYPVSGPAPGGPLPVTLAEVDDRLTELRCTDRTRGERILYRDAAPRAWSLVPLLAYRREMGALLIEYEAGASLSPRYQARLVTAAARCAEALERAQLFEQQRAIASELQAGLLPAALPRIPGVTLAAEYRAGAGGTFVGGDFYDVFRSVGGWVALIGDVCGRGAVAAARTGMARYTARQAARQDDDPATILQALQAAIDADARDDGLDLVSAICLKLAPRPGAVDLCYAIAGHPLPILIRADGTVAEIGPPGTILGIDPEVSFHTSHLSLMDGDTLFLYTDGVTESRQGGVLFGEERLMTLLSELSGAGAGAEDLARTSIQAASSFNELHPDDMATLVLRAERTPA